MPVCGAQSPLKVIAWRQRKKRRLAVPVTGNNAGIEVKKGGSNSEMPHEHIVACEKETRAGWYFTQTAASSLRRVIRFTV